VSPEAIDSISPLAADLRQHDPDRYTATLFAPPDRREALIALYAFDHELARLRTVVREPMAGLIRLQWWDDVIARIDDDKTLRHPVVQALQSAVTDRGLDVIYLKRAIDGRRQPFEEEAPLDVATFERHLAESGGSIASAAAALLGVTDDRALATANRIGQVRAVAEYSYLLEGPIADRAPWLPQAWLEGLHETRDAHAAVWSRLSGFALKALTEARHQSTSIDRSALAAFFPGTLAGMKLRAVDGAALSTALPMAVPKLAWCWLRGRF